MLKWGLIALLILLSTNGVLAAFSFSINSLSQTSVTDQNQIIEVKLDIQDLPSPSYFRVALQKESGETYFGQIQKNDESWTNIKPLSADCHDYYLVSDTSLSTVVIKYRVGSEIKVDNGTYRFKAHRFTSTACSASVAQNTMDISVDFTAKPLITSLPTPIPSITPVPTHYQITPTIKPTLETVSDNYTSPVSKSPIISDAEHITLPGQKLQPVTSSPNAQPSVQTFSWWRKLPSILTIGCGFVSIVISSIKLITTKDRLV